MFTSLPPLSLYVHIPWCVKKCPYCDFNSHESRGHMPEQEYLAALISDFEQDLLWASDRRIESVFIGGGTPSLFSAETISKLLTKVVVRLANVLNLEVTLEANPGTVDSAKLRDFRAAGVNRLSLGVQSFNDCYLQRIGRIHSAREAIATAEAAHKAGFTNFNLDIMFALPGQSVADAVSDIDTGIGLSPSHISLYHLTIEPNTLFHHHPPALPGEDDAWEMQARCQERLAQAGFAQYEVSAYARRGSRCRHNLNYWRFGDYLGIGAGAHGKLTIPGQGAILRLWKLKHPAHYLLKASSPGRIGGQMRLSAADVCLEFMMNALRLNDGFEEPLFSERTGVSLDAVEPALRTAQASGLLDRNHGQIRASERGQRFLNDLLMLFLPQDESNRKTARGARGG
jgi:putative oxygen-independent coproporphyrinogen III oxidase